MTTSTILPAPAIGFSLRVPDSWYEFDIWRATRTRHLPRLVEERVVRVPELAPRAAALARLLRRVAEDAERAGAVYCAALAEPVGGAGLLTASCTVLQSPGPDDPAQRTVEALAAGIPATGAALRLGAREVLLVEHPAGRGVRVREIALLDGGVDGAGGAATGPTEYVVMHTLLPSPGWSDARHGSHVVDLVLASPQVQLADPMLDLFDAISGTFRWIPADGGEEQAPQTAAASEGQAS